MKKKDIKVGKTYVNRGAGRTKRTVLDMGMHIKPEWWWSQNPRPEEPGVLYVDECGIERILYISSFAQWAGKEA